MIYAIATTNKRLAPHFSKAEMFTFYNEHKEVIAVYRNPALGAAECARIGALFELLKQMQCDVLVIRKIGKKALTTLLEQGYRVERGNARHTTSELLDNAALQKNSLSGAK